MIIVTNDKVKAALLYLYHRYYRIAIELWAMAYHWLHNENGSVVYSFAIAEFL